MNERTHPLYVALRDTFGITLTAPKGGRPAEFLARCPGRADWHLVYATGMLTWRDHRYPLFWDKTAKAYAPDLAPGRPLRFECYCPYGDPTPKGWEEMREYCARFDVRVRVWRNGFRNEISRTVLFFLPRDAEAVEAFAQRYASLLGGEVVGPPGPEPQVVRRPRRRRRVVTPQGPVHAPCWAFGRKTKKNPFGQHVVTACGTGSRASLLRLSTMLAEVTCPECLAAIRDGGLSDSLSMCCDRLREEGHRLDCRFALAFGLPRGKP